MSQTRYPLIFIENINKKINYTSPQSGGGSIKLPNRNRKSQGQKLVQTLSAIWQNFQNIQDERQAISLSTKDGHYLEFRSQAGHDLLTKSLENISQGIRLLNIKEIEEDAGKVTIATIYIPAGKENYFLSKIEDYLDPNKNTRKGRPKNLILVNSIEDIRLAILESFWQDENTLIPNENPEWCEIWLRTENNEEEVYEKFKVLCTSLEIKQEEGIITFPERIVVLIRANKTQLNQIIQQTNYLAEIRRAREPITFFVNESNIEQTEWVENLTNRLQLNNDSNTSIYILDTGINNGHQLISPVLSDIDMHSYDSNWGVNDDKGHGTHMSGVAIYGNLSAALQSTSMIPINHILESGKILPPTGANDPKLYGYITQQLVSLAEIQAPTRNRIICMAITTDEYDRGKPTAWSGAIDSLSSGAQDDIKRLIILASGNVIDNWSNYPDVNQVSSVLSPGQSWNALTVGAFTNLVHISDPRYNGYSPLASAGGLSPFSTTSLTWDKKKWPIKPDVLFEGGNTAIDDTNFVTECDDLSVLTTHHQPATAQFESFRMTSAATAKAAWMAAQIQSQYPSCWPETIRGLIVHSAEWTNAMKSHFLNGNNRNSFHDLLRTCGYGVPNLEKALYCKKNNLTLIAQEEIQPFEKKISGSGYRTKDMHFYEIPWPKDILLSLGNTLIKMRVTLSYFIEPGPGEIGWKDRYRYRSHGLKFDVNTANETKEQFVKRVNKAARSEDEKPDSSNDSGRWTIGSQTRHLGSVHSDTIEGTAVDIATCNYIGVFPVIGWWRQRSNLKMWNKKTRYSLIVSIETPELEIDLYTPIATKLSIPIVV